VVRRPRKAATPPEPTDRETEPSNDSLL